MWFPVIISFLAHRAQFSHAPALFNLFMILQFFSSPLPHLFFLTSTLPPPPPHHHPCSHPLLCSVLLHYSSLFLCLHTFLYSPLVPSRLLSSSLQLYEGLRPQDLRRLKDMLIVETADMLQAPLFTAEALLRAHGTLKLLNTHTMTHRRISCLSVKRFDTSWCLSPTWVQFQPGPCVAPSACSPLFWLTSDTLICNLYFSKAKRMKK